MLTFDEYFSSIDLLQNIEYAWHYVLCSTFINCFIKRHYFDFQVTLISLSLKGKFLWDFMNYQNIKVIFLSILFYTCFRFWYIKWKKKNKNKNRFLISILFQNDWLQWIVCMRDDLTVRHGNVPHSLKNFEICMPEFDSALFRFWLDISYQCRSSYFL